MQGPGPISSQLPLTSLGVILLIIGVGLRVGGVANAFCPLKQQTRQID